MKLVEKLKMFIEEVDQKYPVELAYLFGSFAKGTENSESDIDIAILFKHEYSKLEELLIRGRIIDKGEKFFSNKLDVVSLSSASLLLKYEVICNSLILRDSNLRSTFESLAIREYFDFSYYAEIYNEAIFSSIRDGEFFTKKVE
ncbi:MAG TPA: nucleotidyltransferase domain-containing protein [Syntrophomonadaceae bacterium]|nr:nucleotidyltransferase domain-containing protein [Syntrophomonadaceae bacterium]